jgi:hypothetical protein
MTRATVTMLLLIATPLPSAAAARTFVGYATDPASGALQYREIHVERSLAGIDVLETTYVGADGEVLAVREVDFSADDLAPDYRFEDLRSGAVVGMERVDGEVEAFRRRAADEQVDRKRIDETALLVADAGFDRFVSAAWDRLVAGEKVEAEFLAPSRLTTVRCTMRRVAVGELDGDPTVTFRMGAANPLIRLLAPEVDVTYHRETRRLLRYEGPSNIRDGEGRPMVVRIDFPRRGGEGEGEPPTLRAASVDDPTSVELR